MKLKAALVVPLKSLWAETPFVDICSNRFSDVPHTYYYYSSRILWMYIIELSVHSLVNFTFYECIAMLTLDILSSRACCFGLDSNIVICSSVNFQMTHVIYDI